MGSRRDVPHLVAFEPSLHNLFYLTSSLLANRYAASKVSLHPVAVGRQRSNYTLHEMLGNYGFSTLGAHVMPPSMLNRVGMVETVRLDDVLAHGSARLRSSRIRLWKLDVDGFEVEALAGARAILASGRVLAIKLEVCAPCLTVTGSTDVASMLNLLIPHYHLYDVAGEVPVPADEKTLHNFACGSRGARTFIELHSRSVKFSGTLVPELLALHRQHAHLFPLRLPGAAQQLRLIECRPGSDEALRVMANGHRYMARRTPTPTSHRMPSTRHNLHLRM